MTDSHNACSAGSVDLTPEQVYLINDMIHAWIDREKKAEFRQAFRNDCKRLLATVTGDDAQPPFFECPGCGKDIAETDQPHAEDCPRAHSSADSASPQLTDSRIFAESEARFPMGIVSASAWREGAKWARSQLAMPAEPQTLGTAAYWKERHDAVLQKHIECCGQVDAATRQALEAAQSHLLKYTGGFAANAEEAALFGKIDAALAVSRPHGK